jgi:hypothetical protein
VKTDGDHRPKSITHLENNGIKMIYIAAFAFWLWFSNRGIGARVHMHWALEKKFWPLAE